MEPLGAGSVFLQTWGGWEMEASLQQQVWEGEGPQGAQGEQVLGAEPGLAGWGPALSGGVWGQLNIKNRLY